MAHELQLQYTLKSSVEDMLSPEVLSKLLKKNVTRVHCQPLNGHSGLAGGQLSYVNTNVGRYVLKRMSIASDWIMFASADEHCRAVRLWQYGLLDQLRPQLEHKIIACARAGADWAILMHDLTGHTYSWDKPMPPALVPVFLDRLARLHASFWNDPRLHDPRLGLCDTAQWLDQLFLDKAQQHVGQSLGVLPAWITEGWEVMPQLLEADVFAHMRQLVKQPQPLLAALTKYPFTLLHGDYRAENMAYLKPDQPVIFDWQNATRSLMTIDLAWFVYNGYVRDTLGQQPAISYYRERLEAYLTARFDDTAWQAMVELGFLVNALSVTCIAAYWYKHDASPEGRSWNERAVKERNQQVRNGLRWLA